MDYEGERRKLRLWARIKRGTQDECWPWQGIFFKNKALPYGQFWWGYKSNDSANGSKTMSAHRAVWIIEHGEIKGKLHVLHRCNNSICCNPSHLYLGDHMQNMRDRDACGHTSKGSHRYNFIRTDKLTAEIKEMRSQKIKIKDIMAKLKVSRNTVCRCLGVIP